MRGLAHIPVLETLDALRIRPAAIAGTSMGAILGALYASGRTGRDIRRLVRSITIRRGESLRQILGRRDALLQWLSAMTPDFRGRGLVRTDRFIRLLADEIGCGTFEDLAIPLTAVAADFWTAEPVALSTGNLLQALQASMAVPGAFPPVERDGRILVDGGVVNLVPYDLLRGRCDVVVAVDVAGATVPPKKRRPPTVAEAVLGAFDINQAAVLEHKLRIAPPDILIRIGLRDVSILDFTRTDEVLRRARPAAANLRRALEAWRCSRRRMDGMPESPERPDSDEGPPLGRDAGADMEAPAAPGVGKDQAGVAVLDVAQSEEPLRTGGNPGGSARRAPR